MKRMIDFLKNILLTIVYPNRLLTLFRVRNLDQNSNKILGNDSIVKVLALVGAIAFVGVIRYTPAPSRVYSETISNITLVRYFDSENYTYFGSPIPSTVEIILSGDRTDITLLIASGEIGAFIDLEGMEPGVHDSVLIGIRGVPSHITATVVPNIISGVEIDYVATETFRINPFLILPEIDPFGRYAYHEDDIVIYPEYVTVTGPRRFVETIHELQVSFDFSDIDILPGSILRQGMVVAQDINLNNVGGSLAFNVPLIDATLEIFENTRTVGIDARRPIDIPEHHHIIEIITNMNEIQVWGDFERLPLLLPLPRFSFEDLDENGQITLTISLPSGLYSETTEIEVTIVYEEITPIGIDSVDF